MNLKPPDSIKEMQTLTGIIASLNCFISKCSDRCQLLFKALKRTNTFEWTEECDKALVDLKTYLSSPPLILIPKPHNKLFVYLSSSSKAVSVALVRDDHGVQRPIYYVNKCLVSAEHNYLSIEKLALALITTWKRLRHYFDAHHIVVRTSTPLKATLHRFDFSGRMEKWFVYSTNSISITNQERM